MQYNIIIYVRTYNITTLITKAAFTIEHFFRCALLRTCIEYLVVYISCIILVWMVSGIENMHDSHYQTNILQGRATNKTYTKVGEDFLEKKKLY